jgi:hypothetical protein
MSALRAMSGNSKSLILAATRLRLRGRIRICDPCVPNPVIVSHSFEKSSFLASYERSYFRSFLT